MNETSGSENVTKFACPHCGQNMEADRDMVGTAIDCPTCCKSIAIPAAANQMNNTGPAAKAPLLPLADKATRDVPEEAFPKAEQIEVPSGAVVDGRSKASGWRSVWKTIVRITAAAGRVFAEMLCRVGWLVVLLFWKAIMTPMLRVRLARQYGKMGAFAYRNQIADLECCVIRQKIQSIEAEIDSSGPKCDELPGAGRLQVTASRVLIFLQNVLRRKQAGRLHATLGRELLERGTIDPALNIYTERAIKTREYADRLRTMRPKVVSISNLSIGSAVVALMVLISWSKLSATTSQNVLQSGDSLSPPIWYQTARAYSEWEHAQEHRDPVESMRRSIQGY